MKAIFRLLVLLPILIQRQGTRYSSEEVVSDAREIEREKQILFFV